VNEHVNEYLGIKLSYQPNGDCVLTQPKLLNALLNEYKIELDALAKKRSRVPSSPQRLEAKQDLDPTPMKQKDYLHLLGGMISTYL
jgi:hypothetical protein